MSPPRTSVLARVSNGSRSWGRVFRFMQLLAAITMTLAACSPGTSDHVAARTSADAPARPDATETDERALRADTPAPASRLGALDNETLPAGFAAATEPIRFEFPRDHGPHPDFRHEWWYITGHLDAKSGERFGFELTFFRFALAPGDSTAEPVPTGTSAGTARSNSDVHAGPNAAPAPVRSAWRTRQIYMAHFAVTDLDRETFHASERFARGALGLAGAQPAPFRVWLDDWSLESLDPGATSAFNVRLRAADKGYVFDLTLNAQSPVILNGDAGLSRKSSAPGAASYYYSIPRLAVQGTVKRDGQPLEVSGIAWLDREWGSGSLGSDQQGWDWFALQFDDGSALMFYSLRKRDGQRDEHSAGTWLAPDGSTQALSSDDVLIDVNDFWNSPRGGRYPARWRLRAPSLALDVDIQPRLADQELPTDPRYWEGAATIRGTRAGANVAGRAYVELVGYARSER